MEGYFWIDDVFHGLPWKSAMPGRAVWKFLEIVNNLEHRRRFVCTYNDVRSGLSRRSEHWRVVRDGGVKRMQ